MLTMWEVVAAMLFWCSGGLILGWSLWGTRLEARERLCERVLRENERLRLLLNSVDSERCPTLHDDDYPPHLHREQ